MNFNVTYLKGVDEFLDQIDIKAKVKILYNISKAKVLNDPELFKKLNDTIWEFRTLYDKKYYRLLAFWDINEKSLVVCTHGFIKKTSKTPKTEIKKGRRFEK